MKKQLFELIKTFPLPWDYILYIINLRKILSIQSNLDSSNFIKIWIGFIGTMPALNFIIPMLMDFRLTEAINSYQFFLFLVYETFFISIFYAFIIYIILFCKKNKNLKNILAVYMQGIKFYTIAIIFIFILIAYFFDSLLTDYEDFLQSPESLVKSKYFGVICVGLCIILLSFVLIIINPTALFLKQFNIKYSYLLTILLVLPLSMLLTFSIDKLDILPKFSLKKIFYIDKLCKEVSEMSNIQEKMKKGNIDILDFRQQCQEKANEVFQ